MKTQLIASPGAGVTVTPLVVGVQPVPLVTNVQPVGTASVIV